VSLLTTGQRDTEVTPLGFVLNGLRVSMEVLLEPNRCPTNRSAITTILRR